MCFRRSTASRRSGRAGAVLTGLFAALALTAGAAFADWQDDYKAAVAALNRSDHDRAIQLLTQAIREKPKERASAIKSTGMFFEPYLPHYYLGIAYYGRKDYSKALEELRISSSQGVIAKYAEQKSRLESHLKLCEQQIASGGGAPAPPPSAPQRDDTEARALAQAREASGEAMQAAGSFLQRRGKDLAPHERESVESAMKELSQAGDTASIVRETGELKGAVEAAEGRLLARGSTRPGSPAGGAGAPPARGETPSRELGRMGPGASTGGARDVPPSTTRSDPAPPPRPAPGAATRVPPPATPPPVEPPPPPRGERLSPEAAARVRRGVESYYKGDDEGTIAALSGLPQAQADADFYLGSALYRKYLLGREKDASLREEAARHFKRAADLSPGYRPDPRYISPKVIAFFQQATGGR